MCLHREETLKGAAVLMGLLVSVFVAGCKDKSAAIEHAEQGEDQYLAGELEQASSELSKAIEIDPEDTRAYVSRGMVYNDENKFDLAIADFSKVIEIKPADARAYIYRGMAYKNKGENSLAIADYSKAIELDSKLADAYKGRVSAYYNKGEYDKAWKDVDILQGLGHEINSKLLEKLREASGRVE